MRVRRPTVFKGYSLATGVWTGDNKQIKFITETDIDWNDFFSY